MNPEQLQQLNSIFQKVFKDDALHITPELTSNDVERWDSLSHLTLISTIEQTFVIKFKLKELVSLQNVGDLMHLISQKI